MSRRTGRVSDLAFFRVVATSNSLTAAAQELGSSLSAVSRGLSSLEGELGVRLIRRTSRRIDLTPEGELYAQEAQEILRHIDSLQERVSRLGSGLSGKLIIHSTQGFGRHHVAPVVAEFNELHPELDIQLDLSMYPFNVAGSNFDVDIRLGEPPDSRLIAKKLFVNRRIVCASPNYADKNGLPKTPAELREHECLILRDNGLDHNNWSFYEGRREVSVHVHGKLASNDAEIINTWCLEGRGLMLRSEWNVQDLLNRGRLVQALPGFSTERADAYIAFESHSHVPERVRRFVDFAVSRIPQSITQLSES